VLETGADLQHHVTRLDLCLPHDAAHRVRIDHEVLPATLRRLHPELIGQPTQLPGRQRHWRSEARCGGEADDCHHPCVDMVGRWQPAWLQALLCGSIGRYVRNVCYSML